MAQENKRSRVEDDDALVKEAPVTLSWLWPEGKAPENLTYRELLRISGHLWEMDKIWTSDHTEAMFEKYLAEMSANERTKYEELHGLAQEFVFLHFRRRFMNAFEWKMNTVTMKELTEWEAKANLVDQKSKE